jgi:HK97 family phage portal protein
MLRALREFVGGVAGGIRASGDPNDERYWTGGSVYRTSTGMPVTPKLAFQVSCLFHGVRLYAETIGTLPLHFYRDKGDAGREQVRDYWLKPVLDTRRGLANAWQTAQQWRETMSAHAIAWGQGLSEIQPGRDGRAVDLVPLDPDETTIEQLADGRLRYKVRRETGQTDALMQEQVFRLVGFGTHRFLGANVLQLARETLALWLAVEKYNGLYFKQGARPSLYVEHPGKPTDKTFDLFKERVKEWQGLDQMHRVLIGDQGTKVSTIGWSAKDSLLPEQKQEIALDIARWLNLPGHMMKVGQQPTFASIEQFAREFVDYGLRSHAVRAEAAYNQSLITEDDVYAEHNLDGLLRGNLLDRCTAYASAIMNGWMAPDEVRERENLNPIADGSGATPSRSVNQAPSAPPPPQPPPAQQPPPPPKRRDAIAEPPSRIIRIVHGVAGRVVRREVAAITDKASKLARDQEAWATWVRDFYHVSHAAYVAETLELEFSLARAYCARHRDALLAQGLQVMESWHTEAVEELTALTAQEPADA